MQQDTLLIAGQQLTANASLDAETVIIDTGCANLNSVRFAFERLGAKVLVTDDKAKIKAASAKKPPNVSDALIKAGAFTAVFRLEKSGRGGNSNAFGQIHLLLP